MDLKFDEESLKQFVTKITEEVVIKLKLQQNQIKISEEETMMMRYMNQKEACKYLNVSPHTINDYVKKGLKTIQIADSSRTYYDKKDIDDFMEENKISIKDLKYKSDVNND